MKRAWCASVRVEDACVLSGPLSVPVWSRVRVCQSVMWTRAVTESSLSECRRSEDSACYYTLDRAPHASKLEPRAADASAPRANQHLAHTAPPNFRKGSPVSVTKDIQPRESSCLKRRGQRHEDTQMRESNSSLVRGTPYAIGAKKAKQPPIAYTKKPLRSQRRPLDACAASVPRGGGSSGPCVTWALSMGMRPKRRLIGGTATSSTSPSRSKACSSDGRKWYRNATRSTRMNGSQLSA